MKPNKLTYILLLTLFFIISFFLYSSHKKRHDQETQDAYALKRNSEVINSVISQYQLQLQLENQLVNENKIDLFSVKWDQDYHIELTGDKGILIYSPPTGAELLFRTGTLIYLYLEKKQEQYLWKCAGAPQSRVPEWCW